MVHNINMHCDMENLYSLYKRTSEVNNIKTPQSKSNQQDCTDKKSPSDPSEQPSESPNNITIYKQRKVQKANKKTIMNNYIKQVFMGKTPRQIKIKLIHFTTQAERTKLPWKSHQIY